MAKSTKKLSSKKIDEMYSYYRAQVLGWKIGLVISAIMILYIVITYYIL